jgi:translation initiation factor IF-3
VRLITDTNENIGVVSTRTALQMAEERGLDLVEVSPNAEPPVCRIMDFGKFQYEKRRKEREAKKQQKIIEVKEIQLRPKTDQHHLGFKVVNARNWIKAGMKVRVRARFRGRERDYPDIAFQRMLEIAADLEFVAAFEQQPTMDGYTMIMVLSPASVKKK